MENEKLKNFLKNISYSLISILVFLMLLHLYSSELFYSSIMSLKFWILMLGMLILSFISIVINEQERSKKTNQEIEEYYINVKDALLKSKNSNIDNNSSYGKSSKIETDKDTEDILQLMSLNMREIREYYILSKAMAKRSFILSVIMCVFGFIIISTSIIAIFIIDISFVQLIVPVIGGVVVELIAGTSLVVYKKSLEQLNQYYDSLHNNERFLSLVNLVDKLSDGRKDESYINIINSQLDVLKNNK